MPKSKLALVTLDYPPEQGGVARYLGNLVQASEGMIDVFVNQTHATSGPGRVEAVKMVATVWPRWRPMVPFIRGLRTKGYGMILVSQALPVGTAAMLARWLGGLPYIVIVHGLDLRLALTSRRKGWLFRKVLQSASLVITNSAFTAGEVRRLAPSVRPEVITPGVEPMSFPSKQDARRALGIADDQILVLSVTRLVPRKGIDRLIESLSQLPPSVRLVVVGDGIDRVRLENLAEASAHRGASFIPNATDAERNRWYAAADIFALPVRDEGRDVEGFGIVYLEAALAGLPVVAGRSGGAPEAVADGETGLLVDPNDASALAEALRRLAGDQDLRERLGQAGQRRASDAFRWPDRWGMLKRLIT